MSSLRLLLPYVHVMSVQFTPCVAICTCDECQHFQCTRFGYMERTPDICLSEVQKPTGFRPNDSVTNQLICLVDSIHSSLDINLDVRSLFQDMSKTFDKVWHEGLFFKLKQNGINGKLLNLLKSYLANRNQRVLLNGSESAWRIVESGAPQGSVPGLLLF